MVTSVIFSNAIIIFFAFFLISIHFMVILIYKSYMNSYTEYNINILYVQIHMNIYTYTDRQYF